MGQHVLLGDWSLKNVLFFLLLFRIFPFDLLHHQLHPQRNILVLIVRNAQSIHLIASLCQQFSVDDLLRVMIFCLEEQVFVAALLDRLYRIVSLLVPGEQLVGWLDMICQFVGWILGYPVDILFHIFYPLVVVLVLLDLLVVFLGFVARIRTYLFDIGIDLKCSLMLEQYRLDSSAEVVDLTVDFWTELPAR